MLASNEPTMLTGCHVTSNHTREGCAQEPSGAEPLECVDGSDVGGQNLRGLYHLYSFVESEVVFFFVFFRVLRGFVLFFLMVVIWFLMV